MRYTDSDFNTTLATLGGSGIHPRIAMRALNNRDSLDSNFKPANDFTPTHESADDYIWLNDGAPRTMAGNVRAFKRTVSQMATAFSAMVLTLATSVQRPTAQPSDMVAADKPAQENPFIKRFMARMKMGL